MNSLYWVWGESGEWEDNSLSERTWDFLAPVFVFAHVISEGLKDISNVPHSWAKAVFLLSNTLSFCLLPSLASFFLSLARSLTRSFTFSPRCDASGPSETGSQHKERHSLCLNDTLHYGRHITCLRGVAGSGVTRMDAILAQTSSQPPPAPFIYTCASKSTPCVFICAFPQKTPVAPPQSLPISDTVAAPSSSRLCPGTPDSAAPPRLGGGWSSY